MRGLTARQAAVLAIIRRVYTATGQGPAIREIAREIGVLSSCSAQRHVDALQRKGFVERERYKYRSIRPVGTAALQGRLAAIEREAASLRAQLAAQEAGRC
jgi:SOS-response transcriptional repressor LexA